MPGSRRSDAAPQKKTGSKRVNRASPLASNRKISRKTEGVQAAILETAAQIFARKGYYLTKLSDISDELGMHVTALRYHFTTKDVIAAEIVNRVIRTNLDSLCQTLEDLGPGTSSRDKIAAAIQTYMRVSAANKAGIAAHGNIVNQLPVEVKDEHYELLHEFLDIWRDLVSEAAARGELRPGLSPSIATQVILGTVIWSREWYRPEIGTPDNIAAEMTRMLFGGLMTDEPSPARNPGPARD